MPIEWWEEPPAASPEEVRRRHTANAAMWEEAARSYREGVDATIQLIRSGRSSLHPVERAVLEEVRGPLAAWCGTAVHLQCASGRDTLSLLNEGAGRVVGVDFSSRHIGHARRATAELDADATWYRCDVLEVPHDLDGAADLVYTGRGAIGWIHDLAAWARVVARLLAPQGVLCLFDDHPTSYLFDPDATELTYSGVTYFDSASAGTGSSESFAALLDAGDDLSVHHDRLWTFAEIHLALRAAGLEIIHLGEHADTYWDAFPHLPADVVRRVPQTFSLVAERRS